MALDPEAWECILALPFSRCHMRQSQKLHRVPLPAPHTVSEQTVLFLSRLCTLQPLPAGILQSLQSSPMPVTLSSPPGFSLVP